MRAPHPTPPLYPTLMNDPFSARRREPCCLLRASENQASASVVTGWSHTGRVARMH